MKRKKQALADAEDERVVAALKAALRHEQQHGGSSSTTMIKHIETTITKLVSASSDRLAEIGQVTPDELHTDPVWKDEKTGEEEAGVPNYKLRQFLGC